MPQVRVPMGGPFAAVHVRRLDGSDGWAFIDD